MIVVAGSLLWLSGISVGMGLADWILRGDKCQAVKQFGIAALWVVIASIGMAVTR